MTNERTIELLKYMLHCIGSDGHDACAIAVKSAEEAIKERDKYRWHDLRKNPDDLPTREDKQYLYLEVERYGDFIFRNYRVDNCHYDKCLTVAWKEIEPFEEVES